MRCKFIFLIGLLLIINNAFAQWHYTITSQSFNSDCNSMGASLHVLAFEQAVEQWAVKTYSTQEECETARHNHGMINYSSGGCYARVTSTPCQGNAGSGGLTGGNQIGVYYGEPSLYDRLGKDGFVFSPTEKDINKNTYEEYQIRQDAFGYNSGNAQNFNPNMMSARTGDDAFDNAFMNQLKQLNSSNGTGNNYYNIIPRRDIDWDRVTISIGQTITPDDYTVHNNEGPYVYVDGNRMRYKERDLVMEQLREALKREKTPDNSIFQDDAIGISTEFKKDLTSIYKYAKECKKFIDNTLGPVPSGDGKLNDLNDAMNAVGTVKGFISKAAGGDVVAAYNELKEKVIDKSVDYVVDMVNPIVDHYTNTVDMIKDVAHPLTKAVNSFTKSVLDVNKVVKVMENGHSADYNPVKSAARFNSEVAKITKERIK